MRSRKSSGVLALPAPPARPSAPSIPEYLNQPGLSLEQVLVRLRAHWKMTIYLFVGLLLASALLIKLLPRSYEATATLIVNYEINDPLAGKEFPIGLLGSYTSTQIEIMQSPEVLLPVVEKLHLTTVDEFTDGFKGGGQDALTNYVKGQLLKNLTIEPGKMGSQLIYVTAWARDAKLSADIANTIADMYTQQHLSQLTGPASDRAARYSEQLAELKNKVSAAQEQVANFRRKTGVTDISAGNVDTEELLLASLEQKYQDAQNQRRAADVRRSVDQNVSSQVMSSNLVQNLKTQLAKQEADMAELTSTLGSAHPRVRELQSQIEATRRSLAAEVDTYKSNSVSELSASQDLEGKLKRAVEEQRAKVINERQIKDEGSKLQLELESAQSVYKRALDGYDQIMFATAGHYTNVNIASRAEVPLKASKPKKPKLMLLAALVSVLLAVLGPLIHELLFNRRVRCRDDVERDLNLLVLAEFDPFTVAPRAA